MPEEPIRIGIADSRERRRRQRQLWLGFFGVGLVVLLTWIELRYIGADSHLFIFLFNFNILLILVILFVVLRNVVKLILERRRKVLGSRLRTRLVLSFMLLSLIPTALMFVVSVQFVHTSVDYWFKTQIETSMDHAVEVGQAVYEQSADRLERLGGIIRERVEAGRSGWAGQSTADLFAQKYEEHDLALIGVLNRDQGRIHWRMDPAFGEVLGEVLDKARRDGVFTSPRVFSDIEAGSGNDFVAVFVPAGPAQGDYLVLGAKLEQGLLFKLGQIVRGVEEYKKLSALKLPLKVALYLSLGIMALLIILGSVWMGFRVAKELVEPVQALAIGTQRIARGEMGVRLEDRASDELGLLVQSFNRMAADLEHSQMRLKGVNLRLERQNAELEARNRYVAAVLDNITSGVISLDVEGRVTTANKAAEALLGLDVREVVGLYPHEFLPGVQMDAVRQVLDRVAGKPGARWQQQLSLMVGTREMKFLVNVVGLSDAGEEAGGLVAVFEDISELEKMQRVAAWREVARRIAHEIKNPLTPIKLSAQRLEKRFGSRVDDPVFSECTNLIVRQVEHMQEMVREFSAFAKLPEVTPRPGDIVPLLEEVVALFRHGHSRIEWRLRPAAPQIRLSFDPEAMRRVFMNLLANAAEALDAAGREDGWVEVSVVPDAGLGLVRIEVRDNGPGLGGEELSRLFEPYFSRKKGGTGLGLTIARSIINDHRGYIRARSHEDGGSIFTVELPLA